jgi:hypothetical protein
MAANLDKVGVPAENYVRAVQAACRYSWMMPPSRVAAAHVQAAEMPGIGDRRWDRPQRCVHRARAVAQGVSWCVVPVAHGGLGGCSALLPDRGSDVGLVAAGDPW